MGSPDEHRRIAGEFTATVEGTAPMAWDNPAPPEGWVARDVVRHLTEWFPAFLQEATGITLPRGPSVDDDPVGAWRTQVDAVQALLDDPATAEREHDLPHLGRMPLGQAIDMIYTGDVFLHRWDLARATGQDETLDPDKCAEMLEGMLPMDDALRQSGHYGHASTYATTPTCKPSCSRSSVALREASSTVGRGPATAALVGGITERRIYRRLPAWWSAAESRQAMRPHLARSSAGVESSHCHVDPNQLRSPGSSPHGHPSCGRFGLRVRRRGGARDRERHVRGGRPDWMCRFNSW